MDDLSSNELLEQYVASDEEGEAERRLAQILEEIAAPVIRAIVAATLRDRSATAHAEDLVAETLMDLLCRLRSLRAEGAQPIRDLRRYISACACNRCHEWLRERYPARTRLRNQLRYLFNHHGALALWRNAEGELVCGRREWAESDAAGNAGAATRRIAGTLAPVAAVAFGMLREAGAPLTLDALTDAIARHLGLEERVVEVRLAELQALDAAPDDVLATRRSLRQLWHDVGRLSEKQRAALLLNLRDIHGRDCLGLFPLTRTASIAEIAAAVGVPPERFAVLWTELPLGDAAIGELLGLTPRQVIKVRRLARERLGRLAARGER